MKDLQQLIEIARKRGQRSIQLVNQNFRKNETSKDNQLFEGIVTGKYRNDEQAAEDMFGAYPGNRNYRNAKSKLRQKLLHHLFFLDYDKEMYTYFEKGEYECNQAMHQVKILLRQNSNNIAIKILPNIIKKAQELELGNIVVEALTVLRNEYAKNGKATPFKEVNDELIAYRGFHETQNKCFDLFYSTIINFNKSFSAQYKVLKQVPSVFDSIKTHSTEFNSKSLDVLAHKLQLLYNKINWNFEDNLHICTYLEDQYLNKPNDEISVDLDKREIAINKLYAYHFLGRIREGHDYANNRLLLFKDGTQEWFCFMEYYFLLLMKGEWYKKAATTFRSVRTNKNFHLLEAQAQTRWQLHRAFLIYVNNSKLLKWGFDLKAFLKKEPDHPKECFGYNVATLVIQFMFLLREGDIDELKNCVEKIQEYNSTHLDKRKNYRNSMFIRLLKMVVDKNFNYELVLEKSSTYYKKLSNTRIPGDLYEDFEIIPYEILWRYILEILKSNKLYLHYRFYNLNMAEQE